MKELLKEKLNKTSFVQSSMGLTTTIEVSYKFLKIMENERIVNGLEYYISKFNREVGADSMNTELVIIGENSVDLKNGIEKCYNEMYYLINNDLDRKMIMTIDVYSKDLLDFYESIREETLKFLATEEEFIGLTNKLYSSGSITDPNPPEGITKIVSNIHYPIIKMTELELVRVFEITKSMDLSDASQFNKMNRLAKKLAAIVETFD